MDTVKSQTTGGHLIQKVVTVSSDSIGAVVGVIAVDASGNELIGSDNLVALPCPPYCKGPGLIWPILPDDDVLESFEDNKRRQNA